MVFSLQKYKEKFDIYWTRDRKFNAYFE